MHTEDTKDESVQNTAFQFKRRYRLLISSLFTGILLSLGNRSLYPFDSYNAYVGYTCLLCILIVIALSLALFMLAHTSLQDVCSNPRISAAILIMGAVAILALGALQDFLVLPAVLYPTCIVLGISISYLLIGWGTLYSKYHLENVAPLAFISVGAGALLSWALTFIPGHIMQSGILSICVVAHIAVFKGLDFLPREGIELTESRKRFLFISRLTAIVHGILLGLLAGIGLTDSQIWSSDSYQQFLVLIMAFFCVISIASILIINRLSFNILHRPVIMLFTPILAMLPFILQTNRMMSSIWSLAALTLFFTILWIASSDVADVFRLDAARFFAFRFSTALVSTVAGIGLGVLLVRYMPLDSILLSVVIGLDISALVISSILSMEDQQAVEEMLSTHTAVPKSMVSTREACALLGEEGSLSPRELEILELLVQGRDPARIQDILFVSYHTVRNHIKNIYRKLNVHSRQELLDAIESAIQRLEHS